MGMPVLGEVLAGDCPRAKTVSINDRCGVHFPQPPELFMTGAEAARLRRLGSVCLMRPRTWPGCCSDCNSAPSAIAQAAK
jgi:hypothetical protein